MTLEPKPVERASSNGDILTENGMNKNTKENEKNNNSIDNNNNMVSPANGAPRMDTHHVDPKQDRPISCMGKVFSWRYAMAILLHLSFMVMAFARNCMSIALVCMTKTEQETDQTLNASFVNETFKHVNAEKVDKEFSWDSGTQGLILSSSSLLAFLAPLIANFLQPYIGHKNALTAITSVTVLTLFLTPIASRTSSWLLICLRAILGATFGSNVPAIGDIVARWAPRLEKQTMISFIYSGLLTGSTLSSLMSGYLCLIPIDNGWPFIFYIIGAIICVWIVFWHFFSSINPEDHKYISENELQYIKLHRVMKDPTNKEETRKPPYKAILTSVPVLATLISTSLLNWCITLMYTYLPIYIAAVLGFSVTETGVIMTCLSAARFVGMMLVTVLVNWMIGNHKWSPTVVKKFNIAYGTLISAVSFLPAIILGTKHPWVIIGFLMVSLFFQSVPYCIFPAVPLDLAPRYAGIITGLLFSSGGFWAASAPLIAAALTPNNTTDEWQKVWLVAVSTFVCICLVFVLFGDCRIQAWAVENRENTLQVATSPVSTIKVNQAREMELVVEQEVTPPDVFNTENSSPSAIHHSEGIGGKSPGQLDGVLNNGFKDEFDSPIPHANAQTTQHVGYGNLIVIRF